MIPLRVRLKGFLCYKEMQEVSFDGSSLWMLSGLNGSGKSAIFDGVTFALFGHHRGGSVQAQELVNKNSEGFEVEFDFLQDNQAYRIRRTLKKKVKGSPSTTQQIFKLMSPNGTAEGKWEPIEDTGKRTSFDEWIRNNIGLTYETFTSSVLLLQGKAEKLLDSTAKGRFEVLAGIVDLDRYQRLHERADGQRKQQDGTVESLRFHLKNLPEITATELLEAEGKVQTAEAARQQAWQEVERLQALEFEAKRCQDTQLRLEQLQQKLRQTELLLADADEIERDEKRLKELQAVLPHVKNAMDQQRILVDSERKLSELTTQKKQIEENWNRKQDDLQKATQKRDILNSSLLKEENRLREVGGQLREVSTLLGKLNECERQEQALARLREELKDLGEDQGERVKKLRLLYEELGELAQIVPKLERFAELRQQLRETVEQEKSASASRQQIEIQGKKLKEQLEKLKADLAQVTQVRQQADEEWTKTRTLRGEAKKQVDELLQLSGSKVCRHCGQELTPGHLADEKVRREKSLAEAEAQLKHAQKQQQEARHHEEHLQKEVKNLEHETQNARDEYMKQREQGEQARREVQRLQGDCKRVFEEVPKEFQHKISGGLFPDWLQTSYPASADLEALEQQIKGLEPAKKQLREAEQLLGKWNQLKGQETNLLQTLLRVQADLPKDRQALRQQHASLEAEGKTLESSLSARRVSLKDSEREIEQHAQRREQIRKELSECEAKVQAETQVQSTGKQTLARFRKELPEAWQHAVEMAGLAELNGWSRERDDLLSQQTDQRAQDLRQARLTIDGLKRDGAELEAQLAKFPEEARQGPQAVQQLLKQARETHKQRDVEWNQARVHFARLEDQYNQREKLEQEKLAADGKLNHCELLAKLLGRDRLQLHLVRQAERQVVDHANAVLDRLSGGELYLKLCGEAGGEGNAAKALELEAHNRVTGEKPINVAFLSGSQKFRVAVSLALGIGQYASRQHRPIESVIIDEGFGCLDRNARQVMIQELQNLRSQMRCILLVSHQEEFADAFSDGYHFELQNGSTVARRFQR